MSGGQDRDQVVRIPPSPQTLALRNQMVAQCRPLLEQPEGMDQVQRFLADRDVNVIDAIWVTKTLLGGGQGTLRDAKWIVLDHPARTHERARHDKLMQSINTMIDTIKPSDEPD